MGGRNTGGRFVGPRAWPALRTPCETVRSRDDIHPEIWWLSGRNQPSALLGTPVARAVMCLRAANERTGAASLVLAPRRGAEPPAGR